MLKKLIGTTLAATLAVTALIATPASADLDRGETTRLLLGLGAAALVAAHLDKKNDERRRAERERQRRTVEPVAKTPRIRGTVQGQGGHRNRARAIPASCERRIETFSGNVRRVFGRPCLNRAGYTRPLPHQCKVIVDTPNRTVQAWTKRCLRQNGYVFN